MVDSAQPPNFRFQGPLVIDNSGPANTSGAFCDLFTGTHPAVGKLALKRPRGNSYSDALMRRIQIEAGVWIKLNHPRILKFLGVYEVDDAVYLVSPFAEFGSLPSFLERFPNADRTRLVLEIAEGLNYLHHFEPGIIHGDVKGNNVLISSDHHAQLCDFGLARHIDARTATALKGAGSVPWQSPEVLRDGIGKSFETDVYAFGITIYEVLSGNQPYFDHSGLGTIITGVLLTGLRPPMDPPASAEGKCYSRLWNEASRCWSEDPTERPAMAEVLQSLSEPVAGPSSIKSPPQPPRKSQTNDSSPIKAVVSQTPARINIPFTPKRKAEKFVDSSILRAPKRKRLSLDSQSKQVPSQLRLLPELESSFIAPDSPPTATRVAVAEPSLTEDPPQRETYRDSISSSEYSEEIYEYFKGIESSRTPVHRYMDVHPEQVWRARERVVDWLFLVHRDAKLRLETFWMSINLFDRLASIRQVSVKKFQFTVLVCSSLAAKYHEYNPPIIDYWVSGLAEEGYQTTAMFGKCELYLSKALDWRLECPNPLAFLKMISVADGSNIVTLRLAEYPVLIQCFDPHLLEYRPSLIAAAAYWLTKISQRDFDWPSFLSDYTGYSRRELFPPMTSIVRYLCGAPRFENMFHVFASTDCLQASLFFHDWARSFWEEGSQLNAGIEAELPLLIESVDESWRECYRFEEWVRTNYSGRSGNVA